MIAAEMAEALGLVVPDKRAAAAIAHDHAATRFLDDDAAVVVAALDPVRPQLIDVAAHRRDAGGVRRRSEAGTGPSELLRARLHAWRPGGLLRSVPGRRAACRAA